jgi:hypothetical protein
MGWPKFYWKPRKKYLAAKSKKYKSIWVSAAADELHDFVAVAGFDGRLGPGGARKNFEVALDGDAAGIEAECEKQISDHRAWLRFAFFAIHYNGHRCFHRKNQSLERIK